MAREITDEYGNTIVIPDPFINLQGDNAFKTTTFGPGFDGEDTDDFNVIDLLNQYINAGFNTTGPQGTSNPEYKTLQAYLRQVYGDLPEGAVDWASGDLNGDGVNELYAVDADGNPHTVYGYDDNNEVESTAYTDYLRDTIYEGKTPQTWDDIVKILRTNGYSDDEIEDIKSSVKCLVGNTVTCAGSDEKFRGSIVLPGILGDLGYDGSWWDVRPDAGQPCTVYAENDNPMAAQTADPDNPLGEYDADGNCTPLPSYDQPGQPCRTNEGEDGIISDSGFCEVDTTEGSRCWTGKDYGKRDAEGDCVEIVDPPDCTVITQENAEECETDLDNLVECADNLVTFDVANPDDENGNPVPPTTVERPVYARSQEDCDNNTNTLFNCGGGIFANSREECQDSTIRSRTSGTGVLTRIMLLSALVN